MFAVAAIHALLSPSGDGLTLREIIAELPTDPMSVFVLLLLAACVALVLRTGGGPKGKGGRRA